MYKVCNVYKLFDKVHKVLTKFTSVLQSFDKVFAFYNFLHKVFAVFYTVLQSVQSFYKGLRSLKCFSV